MTSADQREKLSKRSSFPLVLATGTSFLLLLAAAIIPLDRRELVAGEGMHLHAALAPIDLDARTLAGFEAWSPLHGFLRGWAHVVGTTERALRVSMVLGFVITALVLGEAAARLFGSRMRVPAVLLMALSPLLARGDFLYPGLLMVLPAALLASGLVFSRGGSPWWLAGSTLGAAALPLGDPTHVLVGIVAVLVLATSATSVARALLLLGFGGGALAGSILLRGFELELPSAAPLVPGEPGLLETFFVGTSPASAAFLVSLVLIVLAAFVMHGRRGPQVSLGLLAILIAGGVLFAPSWLAGEDPFAGARWSILLPGLVLVIAGVLGSLPVAGQWAAMGVLFALVALSIQNPLQRRLEGSHALASPLRATLDRAREQSASGGRLILAGKDRFSLHYYVRRGHHPGVPVILLPEDVTEDGLASLLRDQLQAIPGLESRLPPVLIHPISVPPGFILAPNGTWPEVELARIVIRSGRTPQSGG